MAANAKWKLGEESAIETTEIIKIKAATVKSCMWSGTEISVVGSMDERNNIMINKAERKFSNLYKRHTYTPWWKVFTLTTKCCCFYDFLQCFNTHTHWLSTIVSNKAFHSVANQTRNSRKKESLSVGPNGNTKTICIFHWCAVNQDRLLPMLKSTNSILLLFLLLLPLF